MTLKIIKNRILAILLVALFPTFMTAEEYYFTAVQDWVNTNDTRNAICQTAAVGGYIMGINMKGYGSSGTATTDNCPTIYWTTSSNYGTYQFSTAYGMTNYSITQDEAGHIIVGKVLQTTQSSWIQRFLYLYQSFSGSSISAVTWTGRSNNGLDLNSGMTVPSNTYVYTLQNRSESIRANGNVLDATGSVWLSPKGLSYILEVVPSTSKANSTYNKYTYSNDTNGNSMGTNAEFSSAYYYDKANRKILLCNGTGLYDCTLSGSGASGTMTATKIDIAGASAQTCIGSTMVVLRGHKFLCRAVGGGVAIYDVTNGYPGTLIQKFTTLSATNNAPYLWVNPVAHADGNKIDFYVSSLGMGMGLYQLQAHVKVACATPTFSPAAGTYTSAQNVTISCATSGATIYYTTDGSNPTTSSTIYTGAINVPLGTTKTIKAIAVATNYLTSSMATATYTVSNPVAAPTFSPAAGTYTTAQNITMSTSTTGATIYYTTDGSTPTMSSTQYRGAITVNASGATTVKAIAVKSGYTDSSVSTATYTINYTLPTAPVKNLVAAIDDDMKALVTWNEPEYDHNAAEITGYTVTLSGALTGTYNVETTSFLTDEIASNETITITVVPHYWMKANHSVTGDGASSSISITSPTNPGPPQSLSGVSYSGRAVVSLTWQKPNANSSGKRATDFFNVYRDGTLIAKNILALAYIDSNVGEGDHVYTVASVYNDVEYPDCGADVSIHVDAFNIANQAYELAEVYNYKIGTDIATSGTGYDNFQNRNFYRQGSVYGRKWYIVAGAQSNQSSQTIPGASTAGIITFDIDNPKSGGTMLTALTHPEYDNATLKSKGTYKPGDTDINYVNYLYGIGIGQSAGIAFDSAGNMFVRNFYNTSIGPSQYDVGTGLNRGVVYKRQANGSYTTGAVVDLSGLRLATARATSEGRCDYYSFVPGGDIYGANGADLMIAATNSDNGHKNLVVANIKWNGSSFNVTEKFAAVPTTPFTTANMESGNNGEHFGFANVDNPSQYIFQCRDGGYGLFTNSGAGATVLVGEGLTNNAGGLTYKWGNDLLMISPFCDRSAAVGDFRVSIAENSDLTSLRPLLNFNQDDKASNLSGNSNGQWMYAEENETDKCVYIYIYAPGSRFAKYKLTRTGDFPMPRPLLTFTPVTGTSDYNSDDLLRFDANLNWERPKDSNNTYYVNGDYSLINYEISVIDKTGAVYTDDNGKKYSTTVVGATSSPYSGNVIALPQDMNGFVLDDAYRLQVRADYQLTGVGDGAIYRSVIGESQTTPTYTPNAPSVNAKVFYSTGVNYRTVDVWADGSLHYHDNYFNVYRTEINISPANNTSAYGTTIKPSYYEIEVSKDGGETWSNTWTDNNQGTALGGYGGLSTDVNTFGGEKAYAGNYDFEGNRCKPNIVYANGTTAVDNTFSEDVNIGFYYFVPANSSGTPLAIGGMPKPIRSVDYSDDPTQWQYRATAYYGSSETVRVNNVDVNNSMKAATSAASSPTIPTETVTSIESVKSAGELKAFPVPTESMLNIKSPIEITSIEFYSVSGALVKRVKGNGNNDATVDVSDLAAGTYIVSINGSMSLTIVKK